MPKPKSPYMPWFTSDWLGSTTRAMMTLAEQGAYVNLLSHQWNSPDGALPDDNAALASLSGLGADWASGSGDVLRKSFPPHPAVDGHVANPRLLALRTERDAFVEQRSGAGRKSAERRWGEKSNKRGNEMGNETVTGGQRDCNENVTSVVTGGVTGGQRDDGTPSSSSSSLTLPPSSSKTSCPKLRFDEEHRDLASWMHKLNLELQPARKEPNLNGWANDIRLMVERDKRPLNTIKALYLWCHRDDFWRANILSPSKLREKWDGLELKSRAGQVGQRGRPGRGVGPESSPGRHHDGDYAGLAAANTVPHTTNGEATASADDEGDGHG